MPTARSRRRPRPATLLLCILAAACTAAPDPAAPPGATEILWDTWGVPHIFAADETELFRAHGWAQAAAHGDLVLRLYGQARGRAAEYWGERWLDSDRWVHTVGIPARSEAWYRLQQPRFRSMLDAFAAGINAYARAHPEALDDELEAVLPVSAVDVLAHLQRAVHFTFVTGSGVVRAARSWLRTAPTPSATARPPSDRPTGGSNAWAVAADRSQSGNSLLLANPHLPWSDLFTWFEVQLTAPRIEIYGATLVGTPAIGIGFNDRLGWTHTVNTHDGADLYALELDQDGYVFEGETRPFELHEQELAVRREDGTVGRQSLVVRRSVHGPVIATDDRRAVALRVAGLDRPELLEQWWSMAQSGDLGQFEAALRSLQLPMFTVMYADRDGHILHLFNGLVPRRSSGDWTTWNGVVDGRSASTLWDSYHSYDELPRVLDPASGWLQNANDPPWTTTDGAPLDAGAFPPYMAPAGAGDFGLGIFRAQSSARLLREAGRMSLADMVERKHSTRMELADRLLDDLLPLAADADADARRAASVLESWDRAADADSHGAVLFSTWVEEMQTRPRTLFAVPWKPEAPFSTPDGLADPDAAIEALARAARRVERAHGALSVPWGTVHRLRSAGLDLPANGGSGALGIFRVVNYRDGDDGDRIAVGGDSFVLALELSDPPRAMALLAYGNATQAGSAHVGDQLELFAAKQLRPVWRRRAEVEAHLARREVFSAQVRHRGP